ncbi:MAG: hypothetical protein B7Y56_04490 [Gallionellales bacterium 35-53-114]|jgi:type IV pilus assembly protein PilY1|nr:MAG: hypothetical protein B7Y56_04490 [Gallionellales bacterium 35-53-114]OYZ65350.1 MAG: hypothetical protein B7Y04_01645 [Gallionellales bacterium 24-53-125]OZB08257.1 MAG: hypothetical protein B7X61_12100 [Gallionellales bacterium 39-52-133]HQS58189.1 PilC/PilY family type IV pilus protein [Gallionellaceae bacterium]HQS73744.1 PilC/PilY family type IV pilus protein [Gallionellaceae bacterium]
MKHYLESRATIPYPLMSVALTIALALPLPSFAATVALANAPLANSTTTSVKPNLLLVLDNSGSMDWDHMPDDIGDGGSDVPFAFGYYGYRSNQCNQVYYNPAVTYSPPVDASGTSYANASFTSAYQDGYDTGSTVVNLSTSFKASLSRGADTFAQPAYYYTYSGTQTTQLQKNYNSTTNAFYKECNDSTGGNVAALAPANGVKAITGGAPSPAGSGVFTKVTVSATSGPGATDERTNFANWYSFYRTRMNMMKTATGQAFSTLSNSYRVGLMKISTTNPTVPLGTFEGTQRTNWYSTLYATTTSGSTPLRTALSNAGRYFAGKLAVTDPMQYSCQQNFSILSTDGYWNAGDDINLAGNTETIGNQDGTAGRPMYDGAQSATSVTTTYTRDSYSETRTAISGLNADRCASGKSRLTITPQTRSCTLIAGVTTCTAWVSGTKVYKTPYTNSNATCVSGNTISVPGTNPTAQVAVGTPVTSLGAVGGSSDSLADISMYYYQNDLRTSALGNCTSGSSGATLCSSDNPDPFNNVFINGTDNQTQQHMTTFTLGLGASGWMNYSSSYLSDNTGDFVAIKLGSTANSAAIPPICSWQADGTTCNWPLPGMSGSNGMIANIDDLWHAAVNGRGAYFSATDTASLSAGLSNALTGISSRKGSASAAATSTLNPVPGNNQAFFASYTTAVWKGNLEARGINTENGSINPNANWCAENVVADSCATAPVGETSGDTTIYNCVIPDSVICNGGTLDGTDCKIPVAVACTGTMGTTVAATSDTRIIKTANSSGTALTDFDTAYRAANASYFDAARISTLSQWTTLDATQQAAAAGDNMLNYLRGQHGYEDRTANPVANRLYRFREAVLGDALESQPQFNAKPAFIYPYAGYSTFAAAHASRPGMVYMGANDGMLHAFYAQDKVAPTPPATCVVGAVAGNYCGGEEAWAYVPSMVIPNMWKLADMDYATSHVNFVNGSAVIGDVCTANCTDNATAVWKTILVGGLGGGGRGYFALDITIPAAPVLLWEFTTTTGIGVAKNDNLGYSYAQPVITRKTDGTWVVLVTSGYNNVSPGDGKGHLFVLNANTGTIINDISTGTGNTGTPSGLAKFAVWNDEPAGNLAGYTYAGDLEGNVWRFDINSCTATVACTSVMKFATLLDSSGVAQPITTKPVLGSISGKRNIFIGTGKYLEIGDLTTTQQQTQYAIQDDNETTTLVNARSTLVNQTLINNPDGSATRLISTANAVIGRGWYVDFIASGERVNIDSKLIQGTLIVPSLVPSNTACTPGGYGYLNFFDYLTGSAVDTSLLASIKFDSAIVGINEMYLASGVTLGVVSAGGGIEGGITPPVKPKKPGFQKKRVMWREIMP